MQKSNMFLHAVVAAALMGVSGAGYAANPAKPASSGKSSDVAKPVADIMDSSEMEKCYGVVKAGQNGCAVADKHTCMSQGAMDGDHQDWIMLPKGTCEKLVNGSLTVSMSSEDSSSVSGTVSESQDSAASISEASEPKE